MAKITLSATNPCHVWDMARALHKRSALAAFHSGYPAWRLRRATGLPVISHSARTLVVYGLRRFVPERARPKDHLLFTWQDEAFDRAVARSLAPSDFFHAIPGQARRSLARARQLGVTTVLNHATGPAQIQAEILAPLFARAGLDLKAETPFNEAFFDRQRAELDLADFHCVASSIVASQLAQVGVDPARIWVVPYAADPEIFSLPSTPAPMPPPGPGAPFRLAFAGQASLRKDLRTVLLALEQLADPTISLDIYGHAPRETAHDFASYRGRSPIQFHGPVPQHQLAAAFHSSHALVLPSLEEGFGLVVVQAMACGLPSLVSSQVGAANVILPATNGLVIPPQDPAAWAAAISSARQLPWDRAAIAASAPSWDDLARQLLDLSLASSRSGG
jgi:alpha-maltose-1-phosphate synthase